MMEALRSEIRAILREELAALRAEAVHGQPETETVSVASDADLTRFACEIAARAAADPGFAERLQRGALRFALANRMPDPAFHHPVVSPPPRPPAPPSAPSAPDPVVVKPLLTERELTDLARGRRHLRISRQTRLTPLARDEARRLGIRIERCEA